MGVDPGIIEMVHWVSWIFPSLTEYIKIIVPLLFFMISVIGIFSNILPEPGSTYPVPELEDIYVELENRSRIIIKLTLIARQTAIVINKIVSSELYRWFYYTTKFCSDVVKKFKGRRLKSGKIGITKPVPYRMNFDRFKSYKSRKDKDTK